MQLTDNSQQTTEEATPDNGQRTTDNSQRTTDNGERGLRLLETWDYCNLIDISNYAFNSFKISHFGHLVPPLRSMYLDSFRIVII